MRAFGLLLLTCVAGVLSGCGGGSDGTAVPPPDDLVIGTDEVCIGPFVMRSAAAPDLQIQTMATEYGASFVAFSGVTVDYVAIRELMDRVVFSGLRPASDWQLHICDFFGDNLAQVTFNGQLDATPAWSPDGSMIAWSYYSGTMGPEIFVRPAAGGSATNLTGNPAIDEHPTWSPDGRWIAFASTRVDGYRIWKMLADGSNATPLSNPGPGNADVQPDWKDDGTKILFSSNRAGGFDIFSMDADGTGPVRLTFDTHTEEWPAYRPNSSNYAFTRYLGPPLEEEIYATDTSMLYPDRVVTGTGYDRTPCYSTDGKYIFFASERAGPYSLYAKQTEFPYRIHRITDGAGYDLEPDLGSPTVQTSRVLIGPAGSDHGYDPIHDAAVAGIAVFGTEGYLNFVRLGVPSSSGAGLTATPLEDTGMYLVGVVLSAPDMYYVEEDAGVGVPTVIWDFGGLTSRTAVLYFSAMTGKLAAVIDMGDSVHTAAAAGAADVSHEQRGASTIVRGDFRRVYDAEGQLVAEGNVGEVEIDAASRVVRAF